jgi:hypothetical protein
MAPTSPLMTRKGSRHLKREKRPEAAQATVVVIIDGLNFRREPSQTGELIRGLRLNDELAHLGTADGWHHVRDAEGVEGYVSANPQYTEVRE